MNDRYQQVMNKAKTAIIIIDDNLVIDYVNQASLELMEKHKNEIRKVFPEFDAEKLIGMSISKVAAIPQETLRMLRDRNRKEVSRFLDVGSEKIHVTTYPIITSDGMDNGTAIEWWYATEYLEGLEHSKKISETFALIDELTFQSSILSINAAVEAAHAGDQGRVFMVIANEMRDLSQRCRDAARDLKNNVK